MSILCRIGLHDWSAWVDGFVFRHHQRVAGQSRTCLRCLRKENREL